MCAAFSTASDDECARRKAWVKENLVTVSSQLLKAREVIKETPPITFGPSMRTPEWWSPRLSQKDVPTSDDVHTFVTTIMKSNASDIGQLPGKDRPSRYQGLIENVMKTVKEKYSTFAINGSVEGIMYLPYGDARKDLLCILPWPDNTTFVAKKHNYMGASYFIKWTENPTPSGILKSRIAFARDRSNQDITWNTIFNEYKEDEDMCEQVRLMMGGTTLTRNGSYFGQWYNKEASGFTAVIAIRCTNEFVWYELGWRYYAAAATTASDYVVSRANGEYSNSCGQLIFLP